MYEHERAEKIANDNENTAQATAATARAAQIWQALSQAGQSASERRASLSAYTSGRSSFVPNLLPELAVQLSARETLDTLRARYGSAVDLALEQTYTLPMLLPPAIRTPVAEQRNASWLRRANIVGINVRTIGSFWNVVKYALTLPQSLNAIHLLPFWEPGVVDSLYGMTSWEINPQFHSPELAEAVPELDAPARQLRAVVHLLHMMGKTVGMEVIPHTDRFSQMALAYPSYYEWIQRDDDRIVDHGASLHQRVERLIIEFLQQHGAAVARLGSAESLERVFADDVPESGRLQILFGEPEDYDGRLARRIALVKHLHSHGFEPLPATMAPPYRGLRVDESEDAKTIDRFGMTWRDFEFLQPQSMSRVFNPLARYKLYERRDDNAAWEVDFDAPRPQVWRYVCNGYADAQQQFGFDFMRGDMSHVQMRPDGVPAHADEHYDLLTAVKRYIRDERGVGYFGYFAEGFLAPRDVMAYGDEIDHLEASEADVTLGDLQSMAVGTPEFLQSFRRYLDVSQTRRCAAAFTTITSDKDDPRFDKFYLTGNALRAFVALFLSDTPSYMSLGGETRDIHHQPAPNEHYTKLYVFHELEGPKATHGPYIWGRNGELFEQLTALRRYADAIWHQIEGREVEWLIYPDATGHSKLLAWTQRADGLKHYLFVVNADTSNALKGVHVPLPRSWSKKATLSCDFALAEPGEPTPVVGTSVTPGASSYYLSTLAPGECRVYRAHEPPDVD